MNADEEPASPRPMSDSLRERLAEEVTRMVLVGETKENVMRKLEVNGITGSDADAVHDRAFRERLAVIHGFYRGKARVGLLSLAGAAAVMAICFFVFHGINRALWMIFASLVGFGLWKLIDGFSGMLMAKNREGSVADLDG